MSVPLEQFEEFKAAVEKRFSELEAALTINTVSTKKVETNTKEIVDAFESAKGAFKVLDFMGKLAKPLVWIAGIATVFAANVSSLKAWILSLMTHTIK